MNQYPDIGSADKINQSSRMFYSLLQTPIGELLLAGDSNALRLINFPTGRTHRAPHPDWQYDKHRFAVIERQLLEYFAGNRRQFDIAIQLNGTPFQQQVWQALRAIPYGQTTSYSAIAETIGNPKAVRAVGAANGRNPLPIIIPCHRVIGKNGQLTGFGGGLDSKAALLKIEAAHSD